MGQKSQIRKVSTFLAVLVLFLGLLVLVGWFLHYAPLIQVLPTFAPMQFNTALCFVLIALSICCLERHPTCSLVFSTVVMLAGLLTLIEYVCLTDFAIDELFFKHDITVKTSHPGRMAPNTALCFFLSGLTIYCITFSGRLAWFNDGSFVLACLIIALGIVSLIGYATGFSTAYGWGKLTAMAVHTCIGFILIAASLITYLYHHVSDFDRQSRLTFPGATFFSLMIVVTLLWQAMSVNESQNMAEQTKEFKASIKHKLFITIKERVEAVHRYFNRSYIASKGLLLSDGKKYLEHMPDLVLLDISKDKLTLTQKGVPKLRAKKLTSDCFDALSSDRRKGESDNFTPVLTNETLCVKDKKSQVLAVLDMKILLSQLVENNELGEIHLLLLPYDQLKEQHKLYLHNRQHQLSSNFSLYGQPAVLVIQKEEGGFYNSSSILPLLVFILGTVFAIAFTTLLYLLQRLHQSNEYNKEVLKSSKELQKRMSLMLNGSAVAIIIVAQDGRIKYFNDQVIKLTGYLGVELNNLVVEDLVPIEVRKLHHKKREEYGEEPVQRKMSAGIDLYLISKERKKIPVDVELLPIEMDGVPHTMTTIIDVSKQKAYQEVLNEKNRHTQLTLDITTYANNIDSFSVFLQITLDKICEVLDWPFGHVCFFYSDSEGDEVIDHFWHNNTGEELKGFIQQTTDNLINKGQGVLGKVIATRKSLWIENINQSSEFIRTFDMDNPLVSATVFPVFSSCKLIAVFELFSFEQLNRDDTMLLTLQVIAEQVTRVYEKKDSEKRLETLSRFDDVTNLPNRTYFFNVFEQALHRAKHKGTTLALIYIDIDDFKKINDSMGHSIGDDLLIQVSDSLNNITRGVDFIARVGGDEFILLVERLKEPEQAGQLANEILSVFNKGMSIGSEHLSIGVSIGIAVYPYAGLDMDEMMKNVDIAMYQAKELGKNQYHFFSDELNATYSRRIAIEKGLYTAVEHDELSLVYQPQIDLSRHEIHGFEALLRWHSKELGEVSPYEFIPIAEHVGLINQLGDWVLKQSGKQYRAWQSLFELYQLTPKLSINVSVVQLSEESLLDKILEAIHQCQCQHHDLVVEITESALMDDIEKSKEMMQKISDKGVNIAIDDFGTGYSSLSYLKTLPFNILKIDKSFVDEIEKTKEGRSIVQVIIQLAGVMKLDVIAEGVETKEQLEFLSKCGNRFAPGRYFAQGYYFSQPLLVTDVESFIEEFYSQKG